MFVFVSHFASIPSPPTVENSISSSLPTEIGMMENLKMLFLSKCGRMIGQAVCSDVPILAHSCLLVARLQFYRWDDSKRTRKLWQS